MIDVGDFQTELSHLANNHISRSLGSRYEVRERSRIQYFPTFARSAAIESYISKNCFDPIRLLLLPSRSSLYSLDMRV
jgi:hypothetical protein